MATIIPNLQGQDEGIAALPKPAGDEATIDAILAALQQGIADATADPSLFATGVPSLLHATLLAREYGLQKCGEG